MNGPLLASLEHYRDTWTSADTADVGYQREVVARFVEFLTHAPDGLWRTHLAGHVTGSVLVTTREFDRVLLTLHKKLGRWLQLGGHADGEPILHEVARKECFEESGLDDIEFVDYGHLFGSEKKEPLIYDLDIHWIPERPGEPRHQHYDVRFLAVTSQPDRIQISEESRDLRWFPVEEAYGLTGEPAMRRQFDKLIYLRSRL